MSRGFTFIELLISLLVVSILLAGAAPSFDDMYKHYQAKRLASEFMGFFSQARSEAVMRGQDLYIHYAEQGGSWILALRDSDDPVTYPNAATNAVIVSKGEGDVVSIKAGSQSVNQAFKLERVNGKPTLSGNITFALETAPDTKLKLVFKSITGRFRVCGIGGVHYGYLAC